MRRSTRTNISANSDRLAARSAAFDDTSQPEFVLDGVHYSSYQEMVNAKRRRNSEQLIKCGLITAKENIQSAIEDGKKAKKRRTQSRRRNSELLPRRQSSRLRGEKADGLFVENESNGKFIVASAKGVQLQQSSTIAALETKPSFFKDRINDGSDISLKDAVELSDGRMVDDESTGRASNFVETSLLSLRKKKDKQRKDSTTVVSLSEFMDQVDNLSINEEDVSKLVPGRIYSVNCHPSNDKLIVGAGDKEGHLGLWDVNAEQNSHHCFRVHNRPVCAMEWCDESTMVSASYDGTVRRFDAVAEKFEQIFATYDKDEKHQKKLGRGLDEGYSYWTQYLHVDSRSPTNCFFMATSHGTAFHVDLRSPQRITFHQSLSEKKINSLSLHRNGHSLASAGLDCTVKLWDLRIFKKSKKASPPVSIQTSSKSINSAYFSPSGRCVMSTTMANTIDVTENFHLSSDRQTKPTHRIKHDNHTGRWLSTFMARWHPNHDIFCVGSMSRPRQVDLFFEGAKTRSLSGDALASVVSRCCFHPSTRRLVVVGGNSSGRVIVIR